MPNLRFMTQKSDFKLALKKRRPSINKMEEIKKVYATFRQKVYATFRQKVYATLQQKVYVPRPRPGK